jgi:hypothetical protein
MVDLPILWLIVVGNIKDYQALHGMKNIQFSKKLANKFAVLVTICLESYVACGLRIPSGCCIVLFFPCNISLLSIIPRLLFLL